MKTDRIIAAFIWYAVVGLILGASFEGACISFAKGDLKLNEIAASRKQSRQQFHKALDNTALAAKEIRFWILPVLLAAGLGAFWAHTEYKEGTAFHFDHECDPGWEPDGDY